MALEGDAVQAILDILPLPVAQSIGAGSSAKLAGRLMQHGADLR
jgi:hypothetical protein